ncbi:nucleotide sugar dehydrogenase [Nesterenkonia alkaliphila]|uniref:Nucleotide sugar dehydrogenase n=1 Tax=Nesterenkonia alkaliphila TaxID=1463631 RepID=A0A7K1UEF6_9MICC|nr:nucleotide sugar dehydrogenase [Nesterenkonia alkaliphila]MVT24764.1 nucleotide sugar dehydrogenase [Nesterenkonia alkaliphila]GFZ99675.1 UDP-N-acetyl-D-glucosamine dehydrogenase [Nesterenkonia alkaliphila]
MHAPEGAHTLAVIGQGYVGLPVAQAASATGLKVYGLEIAPGRAEALNKGISHVDDISNEDIERMLQSGYTATNDASVIRQANIVVICVPTPLDEGGGPDLSAVEAASASIGTNLTPGTTVVLESTTYPGTTEDVVLPILEQTSGMQHVPPGSASEVGFYLAFSPERIDPGSKNWTIVNTPKLVGGITPEATEKATKFYQRFIETVVPLSGTKEAETAKLLENTYRHVNIALVNEMARFCHDLGIDIWEVIRGASTKPFGFQKFTPGPGVGGHCIPIDPNYLSFQVKKTLGYQFRFVELAQEINNSMPSYVVGRIADLLNEQGKALNGAQVLLLGVTYKPDIADQRESPATPLAEVLATKNARISFHDPLVEDWKLNGRTIHRAPDLYAAASQSDIVILLQNHSSYNIEKLTSVSPIFLNTRGKSPGQPNSHSL